MGKPNRFACVEESVPRKREGGLSPVRLSRIAWYYEDKAGLTVISEARNDAGKYLATTVTLIPWRKIEASLQRGAKK